MVITEPGQLSAGWIEAALRASGALLAGGVQAIDVQSQRPRRWSRMTHIGVHYAPGSQGECPPKLLLKACHGTFSEAEPRWYAEHAGLPDAPLPRCYDVAWEPDPPRYHLLLRDLGDTHVNCDARAITAGHAEALAEALAALHAPHWNALPVSSLDAWFAHVSAGLAPLAAAAPQIDAAWLPRLERLFAAAPARYAQRAAKGPGLTRIHGDLNPGNQLVPKEGHGPLLLIDHQPFDWSFTTWCAASDLVTAMVPWWDTAERRALQMHTLRRYHAALVRRGVQAFSFEQLLDDYRLCIVEAFGMGIEWCREPEDRAGMRWLWERHLQRAVAAWDDLECGAAWPQV